MLFRLTGGRSQVTQKHVRTCIRARARARAQVTEKVLQSFKGWIKRPDASRTLEPLIRPREARRLQLAFLRNQLIHIFVEEALVATVGRPATPVGRRRRHRAMYQ